MNKFTAAAAVALALVAGSAFAADLPYRKEAPVYVPPPPSFSWAGLYGGINIGYGFGDGSQEYGGIGYISPTTVPGFDVPHIAFPGGSALGGTSNLNGVVGGGQVGYNWQFSPWLVFGVETDIQASDVHDTVNSAAAVADAFGTHLQSATSTKSVDWYGTVRGRVGVAPFIPNLLIYGTGGFAYGGVNHGVGFADIGAGLPFGGRSRPPNMTAPRRVGPPAAASNGAPRVSRPGRSRLNISMSISATRASRA